jgi:hypothetical protein
MKTSLKAAAIALGLIGILGAAASASADVRHDHHRVVAHSQHGRQNHHVALVRHTGHVTPDHHHG